MASSENDIVDQKTESKEARPSIDFVELLKTEQKSLLTEKKIADDLFGKITIDWALPIGGNSDNKKQGVPLERIDKPDAKLPDPWSHPESSAMDGKCGITGVSNMLRLYGAEKSPGELDTFENRSWGFGMRADKFAENLSAQSGKKFTARKIDDGGDALDTLRQSIKDGKPVAIQYMTGPLDAHWVVVTGVSEDKANPKLTVQSWGEYHQVSWKNIEDQWKRGYGGPYPYVCGDESSPILKQSK